jgi:uncharacterized membrane protein YgcG
LLAAVTLAFLFAGTASPQPRAPGPLPELTAPVNDFAKVIDADSAGAMDRMIRALQAATGDVVIVETVPTIEPYGDIRSTPSSSSPTTVRASGRRGRTTAC